jgi:hypothetical protein
MSTERKAALVVREPHVSETAARYLHAAPPVAALLYPVALVAFYSGGRAVHDASSWETWLSGCIVMLGGAVLAYLPSAISFWVISVFGQEPAASRAQLRARRLAHLAFASPPLFTALGVVLDLLHSSSDYIIWAVFWIGVGVATIAAADERPAVASVPQTVRPWLRIAHGCSALAIVLIFLGWHIANHLTAIWSADLHKAVMEVLRHFYRATPIQTALVALFLFQLASGIALLWRRTAMPSDFYGSLQTASGAYLAAFVASHLTAVFVLGRWASQIDTNWDFAIGAPAGLMGDPWNVRLVPHYSLAVFLLVSHLACGARAVLLGHHLAEIKANRIARAVIGLGGAIALVIISAMLGLHLAAK